jgi:hypothetical protein
VVGEVCQCGARPAGKQYIPDRPDQGLIYMKGAAPARRLQMAGSYQAKSTFLPRHEYVQDCGGEMIDAWKALALGDGLEARTRIA